jgi:hypothetical protein
MHQPADTSVGIDLAQRRGKRKSMEHIAQRAHLDDKNIFEILHRADYLETIKICTQIKPQILPHLG